MDLQWYVLHHQKTNTSSIVFYSQRHSFHESKSSLKL
jgi:hypothetical protein